MFDSDSLEDWRAHPVTEAILQVLSMAAEANREAAFQSYWEGKPWKDKDVGQAHAQDELINDLKNTTAEEWNQWYEHFKGQRDSTA